jgi:hypothetical protein
MDRVTFLSVVLHFSSPGCVKVLKNLSPLLHDYSNHRQVFKNLAVIMGIFFPGGMF